MTKKIKINKTEINNARCFIVAELSANHNGKLSNLLKMIKSSKEAGADAVKIQAYEAEGITINSNKKYFKITIVHRPLHCLLSPLHIYLFNITPYLLIFYLNT